MSKAIYPGSFDPITSGHINIIERCSRIFDELYIGIAVNMEKKSIFTPEERKAYIEDAISHLSNVKVVLYDSLTVRFCKENGIDVMIRGIRNSKDALYEMDLALNNKFLDKDIETFLIPAEQKYMLLSSSYIKQFAAFDVDIRGLVPECLREELIRRIKK